MSYTSCGRCGAETDTTGEVLVSRRKAEAENKRLRVALREISEGYQSGDLARGPIRIAREALQPTDQGTTSADDHEIGSG